MLGLDALKLRFQRIKGKYYVEEDFFGRRRDDRGKLFGSQKEA